MRVRKINCLIAMILAAGCAQPEMGRIGDPRASLEPQIVYPGTKAFEQRLARLTVSSQEASKKAAAAEGAAPSQERPSCMIDAWYFFGRPEKIARIDLSGIYVNGVSGEVQRRQSDLYLLGDSSLPGWLEGYPNNMPQSLEDAKH